MAANDHLDKEGLFKKFEELGISTQTKEHPEVFTIEEMMPHMGDVQGIIAKNLFMRDKKKKALWLLSARHDADVKLDALAKEVEAPRGLRLADDQILEEVLGVRAGCVTPFALVNDKERKVKFLIDKELFNEEKGPINFHPLSNSATTSISVPDLKKFLESTGHEPIIVEFDSVGSS